MPSQAITGERPGKWKSRGMMPALLNSVAMRRQFFPRPRVRSIAAASRALRLDLDRAPAPRGAARDHHPVEQLDETDRGDDGEGRARRFLDQQEFGDGPPEHQQRQEM